jgi:HEAT repeat protein
MWASKIAVLALCAAMATATSLDLPERSAGDVTAPSSPDTTAHVAPGRAGSPVAILRSHADPAHRAGAAAVIHPFTLSTCRKPLPSWRIPDEQAVEALIQALTDPAAVVRQVSCLSLVVYGPKAAPAVPALERLLGDGAREVRSAAMRALGALGPEAAESLPALSVVAKSQMEDDALEAHAAMISVTRQPYGHIEPIINALGPEQSTDSRLGAVLIMWRLHQQAEAAVPALLEIFRDRTNPEVLRQVAGTTLGKVALPRDADKITEALLDVLPDAQGKLRSSIISGLAAFPSQRVRIMPSLAKVLASNATAQEKSTALESLTRLGAASQQIDEAILACKDYDEIGAAVYNYLASLSAPSAEFFSRAAAEVEGGGWNAPEAVAYLGKLAYDPDHCRRALELVVKATASGDFETRFAAVKALGGVYPADMQSVVRQLRAVLTDPDIQIVRRAVVSLGQIGPPAAEAVPDLEKLKEAHDTAESREEDMAAGYLPLADLLDNSLAAIKPAQEAKSSAPDPAP